MLEVQVVSAARPTLTVFDPYSVVGAGVADAVASEAGSVEVVVLPVNGRSLELMIARAERLGPVLVLVAGDDEAERALRAGADDVLFRDALERPALRAAVRRAVARREALVRRDLRSADDRQVLSASTLEMLVGGACVQVEGALDEAVRCCDALRDVVAQGIASELVAASEGGPRRSSQRRKAPRGHAERSDVTAKSIDEVFGALSEALHTCSRVKSLVLPRASSYVDLREVVLEIIALVRPAVETVAEFVVRVPQQRCVVRIERWQAIQAIGGLLTNAVSATRERGGERFIELRVVREHRDVAVEISDDGVGLSEPQVRGILQGVAREAVNPALIRFAFAAAVARHASGELLLSSSPSSGTTARMYLGIREPARKHTSGA